MSTALKQLSFIVGTFLALVVLVIALLRDTPLGVAFFRATVVMCVGSLIMAVFFRFFTSVLNDFLRNKFEQQKQLVTKRHEGPVRKAPPGRTS